MKSRPFIHAFVFPVCLVVGCAFALPSSVAPLTNLYSQIEELAVEGILSGNKRLIYQAVAYSPLSAAVLSLAEIQSMVDELFEVNSSYLA